MSALILKLDDSLNAASKGIKRRNKLIRIADKSEAGWAAADEYLSDAVRLPDLKTKRRYVLLSRERCVRRSTLAVRSGDRS